MEKTAWPTRKDRALIEDRLAYHLRCLREDAADPELFRVERLAATTGDLC